MSRIEMWVTRKEPELRLVSGTIELEGHGFEGRVENVVPVDDLTSAERQQAEDLILKAERAETQAMLDKAMERGAPVVLL